LLFSLLAADDDDDADVDVFAFKFVKDLFNFGGNAGFVSLVFFPCWL